MTISDHEGTLAPLPAPVRPGAVAYTPSPSVVETGLAGLESGIDWHRVLAAVARYKWLILSVTLVGSGLGVLATRFVQPEYQAQATIWIDQEDREAVRHGADQGPIRADRLLVPEAWVDLLQAYVVLDQVVRDQRLFLMVPDPADKAVLATLGVAEHYRPDTYRLTVESAGRRYTLASGDGLTLERGVVGDSIGARLGLLWRPPREALVARGKVRFTVATVRDAAGRLEKALDVRTDPQGNFLRLGLRGPDPTRVTAIVNAVAERYVRVAAELKREKLGELTKILDQQVESARRNLHDAETAVERFGQHAITLPSSRAAPGVQRDWDGGPRDPILTSFFDLQLEREQVQRDHDALARAIAQGRDSGLSAAALEAIGPVQRSTDLTQGLKELVTKQAELRALKYRYADAYPTVLRLTAEIATLERQAIPALAEPLLAELAAREAQLAQRIEAGSRNLRTIPPRALEETRLRRSAKLAENVYTTLQQRYEEARLAEASTIPDVRILDSAVASQRPVKNTAPAVILVAILGSLSLASVGAVLFDRADPRVRYPDQVSREMGLPILGVLPHVKSRRKNGDQAGPTPADATQLVEALRGVCLNLVYAYGAAGPMLVTLTSPGAGDGKSFLAANLAHTFAEGGHPTLLVDADIRRGVLHRRLGASRRPGLTDCLRGEVPFEAIVQETAYPSLTLIGCGTRVRNAPELLSSQAMLQFLNRVRPAYTVILIDSPPLAGGVDPFVLGTLTGNLLLVLRTGHSHRELAAVKLEMLRRLPVRLLGAVLNDVPPGAGYSYHTYYLPGYEAADEPTAGQALVI